MTAEMVLRKMLDGWDADHWTKGTMDDGSACCLLGRRVKCDASFTASSDAVLRTVVFENWPERVRHPGDMYEDFDPDDVVILKFNDHPDTTFEDVRACVEKAAALAAERGL